MAVRPVDDGLDEAMENGRRDFEVPEGELEAETEKEDKGGEQSGE